MTTITLNEALRNQVLAALDERAARLGRLTAELQHGLDYAKAHGNRLSEDAQRALVWNIAALHETNMARLQIGEAEPWSESEMRMAGGDR